MSFRSDVSFPERMLDDPHPPGAARKNERGPLHAFVVERDKHELWALLRSYRQTYGAVALQDVIDQEIIDDANSRRTV